MRQIFPDNEINKKANSIMDKVEGFPSLVMSNPKKELFLSKTLLEFTLPELAMIKDAVGKDNYHFQNISSELALAVSGGIKFVALPIQTMTNTADFWKNSDLVANYKQALSEATYLMTHVNSLEILPDAKILVDKVNLIIYSSTKAFEEKANSGSCYIATFVYGDYDAEQVKYFRRFRDNYLDKFYLGRFFIKCYYKISPRLINRFGDSVHFKLFSKRILDLILKIFRNSNLKL
jgi:hypothetical protein